MPARSIRPRSSSSGSTERNRSAGRGVAEVVDPRQAVPPVLDADAPPDVRHGRRRTAAGPRAGRASARTAWSGPGRCASSRARMTPDDRARCRRRARPSWNRSLIELTKIRLRACPAERLGQLLGDQPQVEALLVGMARDAPEPLGERLGVAVGAARADLGAAPDRVPGRVGPFDAGVLAHEDRSGKTKTAKGSPGAFAVRTFRSSRPRLQA